MKVPPEAHFHEDRSTLEHLSYSWAWPVIEKAGKTGLEPKDLGQTPDWLSTDGSTDRLLYFWRRAKRESRGWAWIIFKTYQRDFLFAFSSSLCAEILLWAQPALIGAIVDLLKSSNGAHISHAMTYRPFLLAVALFVAMILRLLLVNFSSARFMDITYVFRGAVMGALYRSSLEFTSGPRQKYCSGRGINAIASDSQKLAFTISSSNFILVIPLRLLAVTGFVLHYIGWYALPGLFVASIVIIGLYLLAKKVKRLRSDQNTVSDNRMGLTQEAFHSIKSVKYLALEEYISARVTDRRNRELGLIKRLNSFLATASAVNFWSPFFAASVSIAAMAFFSGHLQSATVLKAIQSFTQLIVPFWILPNLVGTMISSKISARRIDAILQSEKYKAPTQSHAAEAISLKEATFKWDSFPPEIVMAKKKRRRRNLSIHPLANIPKERFSINNVTLSVPKGSLVAVIGRSGSGKSSFISALLGDMRLQSGELLVNGSIGYCQQSVWLVNDTIRENILFGRPYDERFYARIISQCCLGPDLASFPAGDQTIIGERGATISGGQRQRIGLARVAYSRPEITLLDDPTSAVDARIAKSLFYDCIVNGELGNTTRILCTHNAGFMPHVDYIVMLEAGQVIAQGTYQELVSSGNTRIQEALFKSPPHSENEAVVPTRDVPPLSNAVMSPSHPLQENIHKELVAKGTFVKVAKYYLEAFGGTRALAMVLFFSVLTETFRVLREVVLRRQLVTFSASLTWLYAGLGTLQGICSVTASLLAVHNCSLAARQMHEESLQRVLSAKLPALDTIPIGDILNRFGRDLEIIDGNFPERIVQLLVCLSSLVATIMLIAVLCPILLPTMALPLFASSKLLWLFRRPWQQLQQMSGAALAPIVSKFTETLSGLASIRAFGQSDRFMQSFNKATDHYTYASIWLMAIRRWLTLRSEGLWIAYAAFVVFGCVLLRIPAEITGLVLVYMLATVDSVEWSMRQVSEIESCFVSVGRFHRYIMNMEVEEETVVEEELFEQPWPTEGAIEYDNVSVSYKPGNPPIVKDFQLQVAPKRHIAIVGRSGVGKSTIAGALLKFCNVISGKLVVDGVDIASIPAKKVRESLAVVPQDPVLFTASLRENLDPWGRCTDAEVWEILASVGMKEIIAKHPAKLEMLVDGGAEFSLGQKQLLCLARAVLRKSPIVVMDEATSNLDRETESLMQANLQSTLAKATVLTIAHRLETISDYDEVVVMGSGGIIERGNPRELARLPGSEFARMLKMAHL